MFSTSTISKVSDTCLHLIFTFDHAECNNEKNEND